MEVDDAIGTSPPEHGVTVTLAHLLGTVRREGNGAAESAWMEIDDAAAGP